jgi:hypothetical protein
LIESGSLPNIRAMSVRSEEDRRRADEAEEAAAKRKEPLAAYIFREIAAQWRMLAEQVERLLTD